MTPRFITIFLLLAPCCHSFGNLFPKKDVSSRLESGDVVAVVGASGNVGKLVALRLSDTFQVHGILRDKSSVSTFLGNRRGRVKLYEMNLLDELKSGGGIVCREALERANALVICTGTTAFPTKAWSKSEDEDIASSVLSALLEARFSVKDAIALLDEKDFNTPKNVDSLANQFIVKLWQDVAKVPKKRVIMLSSIGVERRDSLPFSILNACGVLDSKAAGEAAVRNAAKESGFSYTIIRPGQLFGGPYDNNYYLGTLFQLDKDADTQDIQVERGDSLLGDTLRTTLAEVTAQILETDCAKDLDFGVVNVKGSQPSVEDVKVRLKAL
jgi:nucleoside-diphosphate-sugar epimerase